MWKIIAERELRDHLQSTRFLVAASVSALLIILSIWFGIAHYKARLAQHEQAAQMMLDLASEQTNWMMVSAAAFRKPDPMEILSIGVSSDIGRYSEIGPWRNIRLVRSEYSDDPMLAVFQFLDPTFIVMIVLSLIAILFTYNAVNGEKEGGTLKLAFANKLSRADFILGKLAGSWLAIIAPVIISFLVGALLLIVLGIDMTASHWGRYAFFVLAAILYTMCFMLIGVFVSTLTHRSSVSFLILLVVWITAVLIVPKAATMLAGQAMPVPTADEIESRLTSYSAQARNEFFADMQRSMRERFRAVESMKPDERDQYFAQNRAKWMQENDEKRKVMDQKIADYSSRLFEDYYNQKSGQELLAFSLSKFSPASQFQLASMKLSGTDTGLKRRYEDAMKNYKTQYGKFIEQKGGGFGMRFSFGRGSASSSGPGQSSSKINVSEMPRFQDPVYSFGEAVSSSLFDLGLIMLVNTLAFACAFVAFLKFDMR